MNGTEGGGKGGRGRNGRSTGGWSVVRAAVICALAWGMILGGCAGTSSGSAGGYLESFQSGRYEAALREAQGVHARSTGVERARAALIAGQSLHALGRDTESTRWLQPLASHQDDAIAGTALATLGLIAASQARHGSAAAQLSAAARRLSGDDAARAAMYAGDSYRAVNDARRAAECYELAAAKAASPALKREIAERTAGRTYSIQLGAFVQRAAADRTASGARAVAARAGLATPRIEPTTDASGRTLFAVRIGEFASRPVAEQALARSGLRGTVIAVR